jgi:lysophospholipase L1-like esterase
LLLLLPLAMGCGAKRTASEAASAAQVDITVPESPLASPGAGPPPVALPPPDVDMSPARIGQLDRPDRLMHLFHALSGLDEGHAHDDVRVVQFGDSHTAADVGTATLRHLLQARFGDGGRGFVSVGKPWKSYAQDGIRGGMTNDFDASRVRIKGDRAAGDGLYGLLGVDISSDASSARAWTRIAEPTSRLELDYLQAPRGGSFDVFIDGALAGRVSTKAGETAAGYTAFDTTDAPHEVEVKTVGDGDVRVFGMALDRAQAGVVVDALGINGAQIFTPLRSGEEHFAEQLRHRAPDLVILAYGTNEALDPRLGDAEYERGLVELLGRVARAAPRASCLLLGPPDLARRASKEQPYVFWPRIGEIVAIQRKVATAAGCAFYDQLEAMGGPGTIIAWVNEPHDARAKSDFVHLTRFGYAQLATSLGSDILHAYDEWRAEIGLPPTNAAHTWGIATR